MKIRIFTEPQQGAGYQRLSTLATHAEDLGFDGFFVSDHYHVMGDADPRMGPTDALTTLAGLARDTNEIRLGTLVCASTFRNPGRLAVISAEIDQMSQGRLELGIGAGWFDREHAALGIEFPPLKTRFDRMEDQLEILRLFRDTPAEKSFDFEGMTVALQDCPALPKAVQAPGIPIIIGGGGPKRTPNLAARFADEFNLPFRPPDSFREQVGRVSQVCESIGRDPESIIFSVAQVVCVSDSEKEFTKRAERIGRSPTELRESGVAGMPDEAVSRILAFQEAGATRIYLQVLDEDDLDHVTFIAESIAPLLQGGSDA
ncbi:MAG: LLM class F420-dependent oxidoreductase [Acidimicrobiaceae bacterium]|nr:LLM class F420-dependent oxidoreductase [Acidimicrobiaceae bacterium]MBO00852.1 LLM class F420-dependent oxidoreductase [Acidimicrobiaceae bacterium]|tara:strand:- start:45 stop:992 length:948 start_codon:yes stop_codon:yes gene_type:complete